MPEKEDLYSNLNMEDITDSNYTHEFVKILKKKFRRISLYVQSDKLLLADIFENFRNICLKIYEPFPANFFQLLH